MSKSAASERYFAVLNPKAIQVRILPHESSNYTGAPVQLKQISPVGAVLLVAEPPKFNGLCEIEVASDRLEEPLRFCARIDWLRPDPAGSWNLRLAIEPRLSESDFRGLLDSGLLERRTAPRVPSRILVDIQLVPGGPRHSALIRNISLNGVCCLATHCPPEDTRHISVYVTNEGRDYRIPLKVHWWTQAGSDFFLGCEFADKADFAVLRQLQAVQKNAQLVNQADRSHPGEPDA